ncbi:MAG: prepilin peptidase [Candidatus Levyibacteriota bacterium]
MLLEFLLIFILGLCIGSFLGVIVDRSVSGESLIFGKSHCENCKKDIAWYDLIPIVSFIALRAKCRNCKKPISFYYPVIELSTGILFVLAFIFATGANAGIVYLAYLLIVVSSLISIFFTDLKYGIIPDKIIFPTILISAIYLILNPSSVILNHFLSSLGAFLFFLILLIVTAGKGMGWGDVKYAILMGLILGFPNIVVGLYLAFLTGAMVGVILILWRKKKLRGSTIPFGPFLVAGTVLSLFYSDFFLSMLRLKVF